VGLSWFLQWLAAAAAAAAATCWTQLTHKFLILLCLGAAALQVLIPSYMQTVFKLPPEASQSRTMFVHDFHNGWSSTLLMGQEARLYIWEALLFCSIYMNAGGCPWLSANE
jgi:hypothetical protein